MGEIKKTDLLLSEVRVTWTYHKEFNVGEIPEFVCLATERFI